MINADEFEKEVLQSKLPCLVLFSAIWCRPCSAQYPIVEEVAKEMEGKAIFVKVDIDEQPKLATQFKVKSIPSMLVFHKGQLIHTQTGSAPKSILIKLLDIKE